jgi:hypothetical protein
MKKRDWRAIERNPVYLCGSYSRQKAVAQPEAPISFELSEFYALVGAEGFEVSFPSGHYAVFFVEFKGNPNQNHSFPNFSGLSFFPYFHTSGPHSARNWYHWYHLPSGRSV